ncbi:hypothetical protein VI817_002611 [Penicillium citrinum]|nr:hypothetical protein VI817_002611 [Penicillium citrinum]
MAFMNLPWPTECLHAALKNGSLPFWGFVIYRTTYTAQSDAAWPQIIELIASYMKALLYHEYNDKKKDGDEPTVYDEIWARHQLTIMDDRQFNGASVFDIQLHFEKWVEAQGKRDESTMYRMCMVIDDESIQTLLEAPPGENRKLGRRIGGPVRFVKVVEAFPELDSLDEFQGWMKCEINALWPLWKMMSDGDEMRMSYDEMKGNGKQVYGAI